MARPLVVVAATGIAISVVCLTLASALNVGRMPYTFGPWRQHGASPWGHTPWATGLPFVESGATVTRDFAWDGGNHVEILIPGTVHYEPGPAWRVTVRGPQTGVDHLRIEGGRIYFDAPNLSPYTSALDVRITGPTLESFGLDGSGRLVLENIAQPRLDIDIRGTGTVEGRGHVDTLALRIYGSGHARLGELATGDLDASIFGSGDADVAPTGNVDAALFGSGDVRLRTRPKSVSTRSFGSGRVVQPDADPPRAPGPTPGSGGRSQPEEVAI